MTAKSMKKGNRTATKTIGKGALKASSEMIRQGTFDTSPETASEVTPGASPEVILSNYSNTGELNENTTAASMKLNAQGNLVAQNLLREWLDFTGMRMRQHRHLTETLLGCRSFPDLQQAYTQFWQNAFTQYSVETRRMLLITQGALKDASHAPLENGASKETLH